MQCQHKFSTCAIVWVKDWFSFHRTTDPLQGRVCNSPALGFGANREIVILFLNGIHAAFAINLIDVVIVFIVIHNNSGV